MNLISLVHFRHSLVGSRSAFRIDLVPIFLKDYLVPIPCLFSWGFWFVAVGKIEPNEVIALPGCWCPVRSNRLLLE